MKDEKHLGADAAAVVSAGSIERDQLSHAAPKHTPGPWRYEMRDSDRVIAAADGESLFCDMRYYPWCSSNEADWPLIAAAPEMYAALKDAIDGGFACPEPMLDRMRAAIAKAEGK
jgi:hypothetical protein